MNINYKILGWILELLVLLIVSVFFSNVNIFFAVCIFIFHGINLIQLFKTQSLVGGSRGVLTTKQKICGLSLLLVVMLSVFIQIFKSGVPAVEKLEQISNEQIIDLANGEVFPFLILLCFLSALLMFGIGSERRKR